MGCGGSKQKQQAQQDVAARRVLLRSSTVVRGRKSFTFSDYPEGSRLNEAAVAGEAKPASSDSSEEEYFSSTREMESPEAGEYLSPGKGAGANADMVGSGKVATVAVAVAAAAAAEEERKEKDKVEIFGAKEDDDIYRRNKC